MERDEISVIRVQEIPCQEERNESETERNKRALLADIKSLCISVLGIISFCLIFVIPWTTIPRTDSIIHQSHWIEALIPLATTIFLITGHMFLNLITFFKEEELLNDYPGKKERQILLV